MTLIETRQLGIEFERRLQALDPSFEVQRKLNTDTIYSYLNEAQRQVFNQIYTTTINTPSGAEVSKYFSSVLGSFIDHKNLTENTDIEKDIPGENTKTYDLPDNYFAYIRSNSEIETSYKSQNKITKRVQNVFLKHEDFVKYINEYFDQGVILRRPIAMLNADQDSASKLHVHYDIYTTLKSVQLYYYRTPKDMDLIKEIACEMPYLCFEQIVETAVQLYLSYAKGALDAEKEQARKQREERDKQDKEQ